MRKMLKYDKIEYVTHLHAKIIYVRYFILDILIFTLHILAFIFVVLILNKVFSHVLHRFTNANIKLAKSK